MDLGIRDRVALITGASAGIGRATALALASECARVAITYHENERAAQDVCLRMRAAGCDPLVLRYDVTDPEGIRSTVEAVLDRWGSLDILIANAHHSATVIDPRTPFEHVSEDTWTPTLSGVLEGPFRTVQAVVPVMRRQRWGRIVLVSCASAETGVVGAAAFGTAKAGLHGLARSLARELGPCGVLTNVVVPGMTLTERIAHLPEPVRQAQCAQTLTKRLSTPEEVAAGILFLASSACGNVNGETLHVTGGL